MPTIQEKARAWSYAHGCGALHDAVLAARARGVNVSTQVQGGLTRVVRVTYGKKTATVTLLSGWLDQAAAVAFLEAL
jgi:hypothetical protein